LESVRGQLDPVREPASEVPNELLARRGISATKRPTRNQFRIRINHGPSPDISGDALLGDLRRQIALLAIAKLPYFISLQAAAFRFRIVRSWNAAQAAPSSTSSFVTVPLE